MALKQAKEAVRREMRKRIDRLSLADRAALDEAVSAAVLALPAFAAAEQVIAYSALSDEVNLQKVLVAATSQGKRVFLPIACEDGSLSFGTWVPGDPLSTSKLGVAEPAAGEGPDGLPTLCLIPGRAFDRGGNRVGRGGGYYDRALPELSRFGVPIGIGYSFQVVDSLPVDGWDQRVRAVVTEAGLCCSGDELV